MNLLNDKFHKKQTTIQNAFLIFLRSPSTITTTLLLLPLYTVH